MKKPDDKKPVGFRRGLNQSDLERINLGRLYWNSSVSGIQQENVAKMIGGYCKNIAEMLESCNGLIIGGSKGVGKTSAAAVIIKEAVRRGFSAYFITDGEIGDIRFNDKLFSTGIDGVMVGSKLFTVDLLVLDNFNFPFITDKVFGPTQLEKLLVRRNAAMKTTIMTTRVLNKFKEPPLDSIFDVVSQRMMPVTMTGENLRDIDRAKLQESILGKIDT